jgi:hypothetical protein
MEEFFYSLLAGVLIILILILGSALRESGDFSRPYRDLVEAMCPETEPEVFIDGDKVIRIVYDCSEE